MVKPKELKFYQLILNLFNTHVLEMIKFSADLYAYFD